jgi:hypothetical protein
MNHESDRRDFDRFPIAFAIEVSGKDRAGRAHRERTILSDISGGGARFITQHPDRYFPNQPLDLTIYLPGTKEVKAQMRGEARVVRIGDSDDVPEGGGISIAVKLYTCLQFKRIED